MLYLLRSLILSLFNGAIQSQAEDMFGQYSALQQNDYGETARIAILKAELSRSEKERKTYQLIFGLRHRIDSLQYLLWPSEEVRKPRRRREIWEMLMMSDRQKFVDDTLLKEFRDRVTIEKGQSPKTFINNLLILYGESFDCASRFIGIPENVTTEIIESVIINLICDRMELKVELRRTIEALITPLQSCGLPPVTSSQYHQYENQTTRCQNI